MPDENGKLRTLLLGPDVLLQEGDCAEVMAAMPVGSVDGIVTDPPYMISFMAAKWDSPGRQKPYKARGGYGDKGVLPGYGRGGTSTDREKYRRRENNAAQDSHVRWLIEARRVLKPGAPLLAFSGTRTFHRLAAAMEDAGFTDVGLGAAWLYGSGFPKSLNVGKAIDKAAGKERPVVGENPKAKQQTGQTGTVALRDRTAHTHLTGPATSEAAQWEGYGTALAPAWEPTVSPNAPVGGYRVVHVLRKPLKGTVAANCLKHGTGALNIDGTRIPSGGEKLGGGRLNGPTDMTETCGGPEWDRPWMHDPAAREAAAKATAVKVAKAEAAGRWPKNVLLRHTAACRPGGTAEVKGGTGADTMTPTAHRGKGGSAVAPAGFLSATSEAARWEGYGTALKPAYEPVVSPNAPTEGYRVVHVLRKPLKGTVAANCLKHGTGALNIDGCRIGTGDTLNGGAYSAGGRGELAGDTRDAKGAGMFAEGGGRLPGQHTPPSGRWPANLLLMHTPDCLPAGSAEVKGGSGSDAMTPTTHEGAAKFGYSPERHQFNYGTETVATYDCAEGCPVRGLAEQTGTRKSGKGAVKRATAKEAGGQTGAAYGGESRPAGTPMVSYADKGTAARYFFQAPDDAVLTDYLRKLIEPPPHVLGGGTSSQHGAMILSEDSAVLQATFDALLPGAHLLLVAPSHRPSGHRGACAAEDIGFKVRDAILVLTSAEFPGYYCAKAPKKEREAGLEHLVKAQQDATRKEGDPGGDNPRNRGVKKRANSHPTVKPLKLMRRMLRGALPKGAVTLEPFAGSGTTLCAAALEGIRCIGIEKTPKYLPIIEGRVRHWQPKAPAEVLPVEAPPVTGPTPLPWNALEPGHYYYTAKGYTVQFLTMESDGEHVQVESTATGNMVRLHREHYMLFASDPTAASTG